MPKQKEAPQDWLSTGLKSLVFCVFSMFTFFVHQLNDNIGRMTEQLKIIETHQVESDKRIAAIEVSREVNLQGYQKVVSDVQELKMSITQLTMRTQTIADFLANNFTNSRKK